MNQGERGLCWVRVIGEPSPALFLHWCSDHFPLSVCTSGVSAGHTMPHSVLCNCRGFASFPSLPIGELTRRRWERVDAKVRRFNTYKKEHKDCGFFRPTKTKSEVVCINDSKYSC